MIAKSACSFWFIYLGANLIKIGFAQHPVNG